MMSFLRVSAVLALAFAVSISGAITHGAAAQTYPARPVKIIVPFAPGGPADIFARQLGQYLSESLKQSFVIEDRPGAGSILGTEAVARSAPGGHVQMMLDAITTMAANARAGQVRALGTTGAKRSSVLPDVPTIAEAGVPGYEATIWLGLMAPAATPKPIVDKLNAEVVKIISRPEP